MTLLTRFRAQTSQGAWHPSLDRQKVADRLMRLVDNPDLVNQGANGLCGEAAFFNVWLWGDPFAVARFGVQLYNSGAASVGTNEGVIPSSALRKQNFDKVVLQMPNFPQAADWGAEWMMMSALRDASNLFFSYEGTPSDTWGAGSSDGDMARWLRATGLFRSVTVESGRGVEHDFGAASKLVPGNDTIILSIDSHMLGNAGHGKAEDDHDIVLKSAIIQPTPDTVDFRFWSWGEPVHWVNDRRADPSLVQPPLGPLPKKQFTDEFFGYVLAKR